MTDPASRINALADVFSERLHDYLDKPVSAATVEYDGDVMMALSVVIARQVARISAVSPHGSAASALLGGYHVANFFIHVVQEEYAKVKQ